MLTIEKRSTTREMTVERVRYFRATLVRWVCSLEYLLQDARNSQPFPAQRIPHIVHFRLGRVYASDGLVQCPQNIFELYLAAGQRPAGKSNAPILY